MTIVDLETVKLEVASGVARIVLNRPEALNAWTRQLGEDMLSALEKAGDDPEVRAVVFTGHLADLAPEVPALDDRKLDLLCTKPQQHLTSTAELVELGEHELDGLSHTTIRLLNYTAVVRPAVTDSEAELEFAPLRLRADRLERTLPDEPQLELAHRALQAKEQSIVTEARIVDALWVDHDRPCESA